MTKRVEWVPMAFHPGKYIEEELKERKISQKDFSDILWINKSELNNLIKWRRNITPKIAMRLAKAFWTSEKLRLNLQNRYDIYLLQTNKTEMKAIYDIWVRLEKYHPVFA